MSKKSRNTGSDPAGEQVAKGKMIISIGRGQDNAVVLPDANVSTNHAQLVIDGDEIILTDLGSTNGTSIGKVENKISRSKVRPTETVFFGSTSYRVADLIDRAQSTQVAPQIRSTNLAKSHSRTSNRLIPWALGSFGLLLLISIAWFLTRSPDDIPTVQSDAPTTARNEPKAEVTPTPAKEPPPETTDGLSAPNRTEQTVSPEERLLGAIFLIICTDSQGETPFRIGTGFAIDSDSIVTSASVIQAMSSLQQNGYPQAFLYSPASDREWGIASTTIHPQFAVADVAARKAQQTHDAIFDQLESKPPEPDAFDAVKKRLIAARSKALEAMDQKATYDVAVIKTMTSLEHWLPGASADAKLRPNQKVKVTGYAFDVEDPYFDRSAPLELSTMSTRVGQLVKGAKSSNGRMIAKGNAEHHDYAYLGSPVLNSQDQVVGVYSRPTPPTVDSEEESEPSFDVALFTLVDDCRQP